MVSLSKAKRFPTVVEDGPLSSFYFSGRGGCCSCPRAFVGPMHIWSWVREEAMWEKTRQRTESSRSEIESSRPPRLSHPLVSHFLFLFVYLVSVIFYNFWHSIMSLQFPLLPFDVYRSLLVHYNHR